MVEDREPDDRIGQTLGKKFLVRRCIGSGGMGAVYDVEHVLTKRCGALKLLHRSAADSPRLVARFVREASAAGRIGNPHIVETIDAGELPSGEPYLFMELLDGTPVSELVKRRGRLSFAEAREIVLQAADGLAAAHAAGIVHRDVKPENLFLCRGDTPFVKVLDFGISKFEDAGDHRLTAEGAPMGTPYYMSPEQVAGKSDVGPSSDIYSLGVVLYECVTGQVPFDAPTLPALSIKIFEGSYAPASSLASGAVVGLDQLLSRAMATTPRERFASMAEFRQALVELGGDVPRSLVGTLESFDAEPCAGADDLDETADLAPSSQARVVHARSERAAPSVDERPAKQATIGEPSKSPARVAFLAVGVAAVSLTAWLLARGPDAPGSAEVDASTKSSSATTAALPEPEPPVLAPPDEIQTGAPSAVRPPAPKATARPQTANSAGKAGVSRAARDGLSEQNPFE